MYIHSNCRDKASRNSAAPPEKSCGVSYSSILGVLDICMHSVTLRKRRVNTVRSKNRTSKGTRRCPGRREHEWRMSLARHQQTARLLQDVVLGTPVVC